MRLQAKISLVSAILIMWSVAGHAAQPRPTEAPAALCAKNNQPLNEERFVRIGGIEQWVTINGASCANPVILFLHGGPGNPLSPYADTIYGAWQKDFTLVQWDQRGAGRTFGRGKDQSGLTIEVMTRDGNELASYLIDRLGQKKIILIAGSWGSVLGVHRAKTRPDLFHAYLGVGQLVDHRENLTASHRRLIALARAAGDAKTLASLEALGAPPWTNPRSFGAMRRATRSYEAKSSTAAPVGWWKPSPAYATDEALANYEAGEDFSYLQFVGLAGDGMLSTVSLPKLGTDFRIPFYLVQGAEDLVTVPEVARAYFDSITAPSKKFRLVPSAGHDPNAALVDAQYEILKTDIRPLAR